MELSRNLKIDSVARLQPTPAHVVESDRPAREAVTLLRELNVGCLLITRRDKVVGIFTERDLLTRILAMGLPLSTPLAECMTPDPVTVQPKDSVRGAIQKMEKGGYRHLPVVDEAGHPVGILSAKRIVRYLVEHFPATVYCLPADPESNIPDKAEGA